MAYSSPAGTGFYISQTFASALPVTIATNANPCLATSTGHGLVDNDEVLFNSGWELAANSAFRVDQQSADTFRILGLNTTNTNRFASGAGVGSVQKISGWIEIPQVLSVDPSGGEGRTIDFQPIKNSQGLSLPDGFTATVIGFGIGFDPSLANWETLLDISRGQVLVAYKQVKGSGAASYGYGYFQMSEVPIQQSGQVDRVNARFLSQGRVISYA